MPRPNTETRLTPTSSKRSRADPEDSGLGDDEPPISDRVQEKLASIMANQLKLFEGQLSNHVITMREQDHAAREQSRQITQSQLSSLEEAQLNQSNALSLVAERLEAGLNQLALTMEAFGSPPESLVARFDILRFQ